MFRGELLFCKNCGKNHYITIGGGLYIEGFSDSLTRKMKSGAYGEEYKELVNSKPFVFVDGLRKVYYCDNCANSINIENCDDCHRKYQNWALDKDTAAYIIDRIIKEC